jgi:hypothetical protein
MRNESLRREPLGKAGRRDAQMSSTIVRSAVKVEEGGEWLFDPVAGASDEDAKQ